MSESADQRFRSGIRAVVFDLDGTLIDSMPLVLRAFAHALAPFRPDLDENAIFLSLGGPPARILLELIGDEEKTAEALKRLDTFGFENGALVSPFDGMRNFLEELQARGLQLAIWTGRDRHTTEAIFKAHDLAGFFPPSCVVTIWIHTNRILRGSGKFCRVSDCGPMRQSTQAMPMQMCWVAPKPVCARP
jgi:hypothetical protein